MTLLMNMLQQTFSLTDKLMAPKMYSWTSFSDHLY
jgi:hypothetical protein